MSDLTSKDGTLIRKLNEIILSNLENENFGVKELAHEIGMSRFNLNRKLHFICRKTINQYIREVRLRRAMDILQQEAVTASEVAYKVGYSSPAYFSTCFSEHYGYPPGEAKKRGLLNPGEKGEGVSVEPLVAKPFSAQNGIKLIKRTKAGRWAIAIFSVLIVLIIVLFYYFNIQIPIGFNFITSHQSDKQKKSIAVLPFINDSKDPENVYFINGVMEAILDKLSKIKDLDVRPRTSIEQYRNDGTKTIPQIAHELGVNYIIEGSGQKIGDRVSLYIQLIEAGSDKHLFSNQYNMKLEDIFDLQSEVAIKVASEIKALITIEEKEQIAKTPTTSIEALNLFLLANDFHNIAESEGKWELDIKAERLYRKAIQLDSTYADPYASLGWIVFKRNPDSALYLANRSLNFDDENPEAYLLKGYIYYYTGFENEAEEAYLQSLKFKPNNSTAFRYLGELYFYVGKCYNSIENQLQAFHLENNSMHERNNLENFSSILYSLGFYAEGKKYAEKLLELDNDSSDYYWGLATIDLDLGNNESALQSARKIYAYDTEDLDHVYLLFNACLYASDFNEAYLLMNKYMGIMQKQGRKIEPNYLFGFTYMENGYKEQAAYHFESQIKDQLDFIKLNQPSVSCRAYLELAKIYSVLDEKTKAIDYLQKVKDCMDFTSFRVKDYKYCTMFDNIRQEPGFADYLKEADARYEAEHQKVKKLLRKEGILTSSL